MPPGREGYPCIQARLIAVLKEASRILPRASFAVALSNPS